MKFEINPSSLGVGFELVISISDFNKAAKSQKELDSLLYIVNTFFVSQDAKFVFGIENYDLISKRIPKSGNLQFVIKENCFLYYNPPRWCEVYVTSNNTTKLLIGSDDEGNTFYISEE